MRQSRKMLGMTERRKKRSKQLKQFGFIGCPRSRDVSRISEDQRLQPNGALAEIDDALDQVSRREVQKIEQKEQQSRGRRRRPDREIKFAHDSLVEGERFEPSVPP